MGVAPKILDGIAKTVKGLFDIRAPVFPIKAILERLSLKACHWEGSSKGAQEGEK